MEKRLIDTLIRIVQSPETQFLDGAGLKDFRQRYGIGFPVGTTRVRFSDKDKAEIASLLKAKAGIDTDQVKPGAWQGLTRAEALDLGHNEKLARGAVKRDRISVKAVPGYALKLSGRHLSLPDYAHVDINWREISALEHPVAGPPAAVAALDEQHSNAGRRFAIFRDDAGDRTGCRPVIFRLSGCRWGRGEQLNRHDHREDHHYRSVSHSCSLALTLYVSVTCPVLTRSPSIATGPARYRSRY